MVVGKFPLLTARPAGYRTEGGSAATKGAKKSKLETESNVCVGGGVHEFDLQNAEQALACETNSRRVFLRCAVGLRGTETQLDVTVVDRE